MTASPSATTTSTLADHYRVVRDHTEELAAPLGPEDQTVQSMPDVSPTKWHRAHTTWFFETFLLSPLIEGYESVDPAYGFLFNSYYEGVGPRHARDQRGLISRPTAAEIGQYRAVVDQRMLDALDEGRFGADAVSLIELGLHHEQQHQELLLMDIQHVLWSNPLGPVYREGWDQGEDENPPIGWIPHAGGVVGVGHSGGSFAFDNEGPRHEVLLRPFALADRVVSAGDWCDFIDDGGYRRADLWLSDGWALVNQLGWEAPLYWRRGDGRWETFTLGGWRPVTRGEPVRHVSYHEADAYAHWAGARLPTEFEWEAVSPPPGPVWQWTSSAYQPYPGFRPAAGAVGEYNGKFMVNQQVLRGGAAMTPAGHLRPTYRNFFPAAARWPFAGLRLARDA